MRIARFRGPYNCPFCGGIPEIVKERGVGTYVRCSDEDCVAHTCHMAEKKKSDAIAIWNRRNEF